MSGRKTLFEAPEMTGGFIMSVMKRIMPTIAVFLIMALAFTVKAEASMGFSVNPSFPENQRSNSGFYELRITPGQEQDIIVTVVNPTNTQIAVTVEAFTVSTARSGTVDYSNTRVNDETLPHLISDLITIAEPRVIIPAHSEEDVILKLTAPDESFDGILLGSLRFLREPTEDEIESAGAIMNRYAQAIAIRLSMNDRELDADFALGEITSQITNARASIVVDVRNPMARMARGVRAEARIFERDSNREIFYQSLDEVDFAPNSVFPLTMVDRAGYGLNPGIYRAEIMLEYEGQTWQFDQEFEIAPTQAARVNSQARNQNQQQAGLRANNDAINPLTWAMIGAGALVVVVAIVLIIRQKRKSEEILELQQRILAQQKR